ncbi:MAG: hypothetical protein WBD83_10485, partial [Xanthobacteraceae bacterium]
VPESAGQTDVTRGLWYAFTAGAVRVISIANDDVAYQDGGNSYVRGYSSGAQKAWLEKELAATRGNPDVDWVVVCMHQVAISTADRRRCRKGRRSGVASPQTRASPMLNTSSVLCTPTAKACRRAMPKH